MTIRMLLILNIISAIIIIVIESIKYIRSNNSLKEPNTFGIVKAKIVNTSWDDIWYTNIDINLVVPSFNDINLYKAIKPQNIAKNIIKRIDCLVNAITDYRLCDIESDDELSYYVLNIESDFENMKNHRSCILVLIRNNKTNRFYFDIASYYKRSTFSKKIVIDFEYITKKYLKCSIIDDGKDITYGFSCPDDKKWLALNLIRHQNYCWNLGWEVEEALNEFILEENNND